MSTCPIPDMNLTILNDTEFLWKSNGDYSGELLKTINQSSETECATNCANTPDCTAFKFTNPKHVINGSCELHSNWQHIKSGNVSIFLRLSFPYEGEQSKIYTYNILAAPTISFLLLRKWSEIHPTSL